MFESRLLGTLVPYGTVMELTGILTQAGPSALITLERLDPAEDIVVSCGERRFRLVITQDMVVELCQTSQCSHSMMNWAITRCSDHLGDCTPELLDAMAGEWGYATHDEAQGDISRYGSDLESALLIRAAVAQGAYAQVSRTLLHACFEDPDVIDEVCWSETDATAMRESIERDRLRLEGVARRTVAALRAAGT
ncbi:hypothetical protein ABZ865_41415 [Streptomyces sp. NPDC047085]|uniref:hypothetical protein n=1 Tax=Streptomyces sp. NPDC047085 TaxID=3155140 RepID=UPI0033E0E611